MLFRSIGEEGHLADAGVPEDAGRISATPLAAVDGRVIRCRGNRRNPLVPRRYRPRPDCRRDLGLLADDVEIYPLNYPNSPFVFLGHYAEVWIDGMRAILTHYPIASWNGISKGSYNIHGHCHRNLKEDMSLARLDVGWEWKRRPVEWSEIVKELSPRKTLPPDHHGRDDQ